MLDPNLLEEYMGQFYGYGNLKGKFWFIGMEEGQGDTNKEVKDRKEMQVDLIEGRLEAWRRLGKKQVEDILDFHREIQASHHFKEGAKPQPTWAGLIRILLTMENETVNDEAVLRFQINQLGRHDSNHCLLELLPLAASSLSHWFPSDMFQQHPSLSYLSDRKSYEKAVAARRVAGLRTILERHKEQPKIVIFYGKKYERRWRKVIGQKFEPAECKGLYIAQAGQTLYAMTYHPVPRYGKLPFEYFTNAGRELAKHFAILQNR